MAKREYYLNESAKVNNELKRLLFEEKGWTLKKDSKTCKVFCIPTDRPDSFVWKGEATVPIQPEKLIDMAHPTANYRLMWDPNVLWCRLLEEITNQVFICHTASKAHLLGLLSSRDTIDVFRVEENDKYLSCQFGGIEYEKAPAKVPECVRAWSYPSGIFIFKNETKSEPPATRVVTFFQVDAKLDVVPPAMLNAAMPKFVKDYFKALKKTEGIAWKPLTDVPGRREVAQEAM